MKTGMTFVTQKEQFAKDSSKRARALEKFRLLNEATMKALRRAGLEREEKEREELVLRETPPPYGTQPK